jgi:hypothetical protein
VNFNSLVLEALDSLKDYFNQSLKIGDNITFQGGDVHMSYPEEGTIVGIYLDKLIVKNSETGKLLEITPGNSVLNDGKYYIDDLDFDEMENFIPCKPVGKNHPWRIRKQLKPNTAETFGDLIDEL